MMKRISQVLTLLTLGCLSGLAFAHVGPDGAAHHGFTEGFSHPFTGLDHLAAMLAVGIWSAGSARRQWLAPAVFVIMLLAAALLAQGGLVFPAVEPMIAASLVAAGLLLLLTPLQQLPPAVGALLMGGFALFHGAAHGQELAGAGALIGMGLATALLHGLGIALGHALRRWSIWLPRAAGAGVALMGIGLLA
ncbi:HupE/UreJ family protein [Roseateles sp. DAIF2]|uniref:HupE/UreJ family protein n=1 Tax=Roseateles sp. DAIF2 TaxID=2714952 RepID=UPI0018A30538|nr:HupE/UreJ family protein [Roseateles sp. DAIF2]QPF75210.1 HupE/UreJ family protein [Roseateles sp. DAIF2]